ncbi:MAG: long-chain fatty acid--CoA ligase [Peptococcaceae bacterium]|nr:long-chain fatty acid--CoA ligase [Peptococcaceae bacterium]
MAFGDSRPWLENYAPGVRPHLDYPDMPLYRLLDNAVANYPDVPATIFLGNELTYRELGDRVNRLARALAGLGVRKGDRVAIMLPNCPQLVAACFGVLKAGAVVVQINPMYMERELEYQLNNSGAESIILLDTFLPRLQDIKSRTAIKNIVAVTFAPEGRVPDGGVYNFEELLAKAQALPPSLEIDPRNDPAMLQYTGGTTGVSKGAVLTHFNLVANALQVREAVAGSCPAGREKVLVALPLFHAFGMTMAMNLALSIAGTQILVPRFEIDAVLRAIHDHRPAFFPGAPTMFMAVARHPGLGDYDLSSVKVAVSASAPLPREVAEKFESLTGGRLVEGYGLTEASPLVAVNPVNGVSKPGSIGQPVPDTDCRIVNLDTGEKELGPGEIGELIVRGPQVMKGYWNRPEETANALRGGWLYTGDVARMDEEGYIYIVGRKKDMIISGGFNVYPRDVEEVLYEHPKITEAVVLGSGDLNRSEWVKAFVVLKEGETATAEEIVQFCRDRLPGFKVPKEVEFRESLPKTIVGKILRRVLIEEERNRTGRN